MSSRKLSELETRLRQIEKQYTSFRESVTSRISSSVQGNDRYIKVELAEDVPERYTAIKIVHNDRAQGTFAKGIVFGGTHTDNDLENFTPAIAQTSGASGDVILAQVTGISFVLNGQGTSAYGADNQIKAGDPITVSTSVPGKGRVFTGEGTVVFSSLESAHSGEDLIMVNIGTANSGATQKWFPVRMKLFLGGVTYQGDVYANGPEFDPTEEDVTMRPFDGDNILTIINIPTDPAKHLFFTCYKAPDTDIDSGAFLYYFNPTRYM